MLTDLIFESGGGVDQRETEKDQAPLPPRTLAQTQCVSVADTRYVHDSVSFRAASCRVEASLPYTLLVSSAASLAVRATSVPPMGSRLEHMVANYDWTPVMNPRKEHS